MTATTHGPYRILHVEDDPAHAALVRRCMRDRVEIHHDATVDGALSWVRRSERRPHLVLLDLKLPGKSGIDLLRAMKQDEELRRIPVVILTTSTAPDDLRSAWSNHCNSYLQKPSTLKEFQEMVEDLYRYWFEHNQGEG